MTQFGSGFHIKDLWFDYWQFLKAGPDRIDPRDLVQIWPADTCGLITGKQLKDTSDKIEQ